MFLEVRGLTKEYDRKRVLDNIGFKLEKGEILCLLGPSGCGKTTILNIIGGFVKPDSGKIIMDGKDITELTPEMRQIATVFQSYGLFSHKNVSGNVGYGLKFKKIPKRERLKKIREVLKAVGLEGYEERRIHELSGGQQQRVALARSIVINPGLILLDEPFSNLDENLKDSMRKELKRLVNHFGMTAILVTHDQEDAFIVADKVILMDRGRIVQNDTPVKLYNTPNSEFSLNFIGKSNKLVNNGFIRPEKIRLYNGDESFQNPELKELYEKDKNRQFYQYVKGTIIEVLFKGTLIEYIIETDDNEKLNVLELNRGSGRKIGDIVLAVYEKSNI